jgi:DNA polymerase I-like protein with 3'-5' exonuclease and polymerase domains
VRLKVREPKIVRLPDWVSIDTETTGIHPLLEDMPFSVGLMQELDERSARYFEWLVDPRTRLCKPDREDIVSLQEIAGDETATKVFFHAKFDLHNLAKIGIEVKGRIEDVSIAARVCNTLEMHYKLKILARKYFGYPLDDQEFLKGAIMRKLRDRARKKGWNLNEKDPEADYWLCSHVDELIPEMPKKERDRVKMAVGVYCLGDVTRTALLWTMYKELMDSDPHYKATYEEEMELMLGAVMAMERRGVPISRKRTLEELKDCKEKRAKHRLKLREMASKKGNKDYNPNSDVQSVKLLFTRSPRGYGLTPIKATKKGNVSVDWKALRPYMNHPFVRELLAYRAADRGIDFFETYLDLMRPDPVHNPDGKGDAYLLFPSANQAGTKTGRFSYNEPNLQQVSNPDSSVKGTDPVQARRPFGPRKGYFWYTCDYNAQELRVFADVADVTAMLEAVYAGRDVPTENANRLWGGRGNQHGLIAAAQALELGADEPSKEEIRQAWKELGWNSKKAANGVMSSEALRVADRWLSQHDYDIVAAEKSIGKKNSRGRSKQTGFTKYYGGGADALADLINCEREEAVVHIKRFDHVFPESPRYIKALTRQAKQDGYIINRYGRKLRVDSSFAYRAVNYMVQGTCADLMKDAIRRCHKFFREIGIDAHIVMTIHDELIFEIKKDHAYKWVLREICRIMSDHQGRLRVPMPVEMKRVRERWDRKEPVEL